MKGFLKVIIVLAVIIAVVFAGRNVIAKFAVEKGMKAATGLSLKIEKIDLNVAKTHVGINELSLMSPEGFGDEVMFYAPEIFVDYNLGAILKGKIHLEDIRLDFDKLVVVRNKEGKLNLDALKPKGKKEQGAKEKTKKEEAKEAKEKKAPKIQIDHLALRIGKVVYKDYSQGGDPVIKEYNVNISEEIDDVTDPNNLMNFVVTKAMAKTALSSLGDFNIDAVKDAVGDSQSTIDALKNHVGVFKGAIKFPSQK